MASPRLVLLRSSISQSQSSHLPLFPLLPSFRRRVMEDLSAPPESRETLALVIPNGPLIACILPSRQPPGGLPSRVLVRYGPSTHLLRFNMVSRHHAFRLDPNFPQVRCYFLSVECRRRNIKICPQTKTYSFLQPGREIAQPDPHIQIQPVRHYQLPCKQQSECSLKSLSRKIMRYEKCIMLSLFRPSCASICKLSGQVAPRATPAAPHRSPGYPSPLLPCQRKQQRKEGKPRSHAIR